MDPKAVKAAVEKILTTDEDSTNEELLEQFMKELNLPKDLAKKYLAQRGAALNDPQEFKLKLK